MAILTPKSGLSLNLGFVPRDRNFGAFISVFCNSSRFLKFRVFFLFLCKISGIFLPKIENFNSGQKLKMIFFSIDQKGRGANPLITGTVAGLSYMSNKLRMRLTAALEQFFVPLVP